VENHVVIRQSEKELLGFDHQQVGTWIAEKWKLPPILVTAIRYHHAPTRARDERDMAAAVHVGNNVARAFGVGNSGDRSIAPFDESVVEQYGVDAAFIAGVAQDTAEELERAGDFFDLIQG
jgi:HD-like signal output (HDOD) protein